MTGYTTHTGPSQKFNEGWAKVFGAKTAKAKAKPPQADSKPAQPAAPKAKKSS